MEAAKVPSHSVTDRALIAEESRYGSVLIKGGVGLGEWEKGSMLTVSQEAREERENGWEECNLAKFSQFLGFPIEGLEKEIVNFLAKSEREEKRYTVEETKINLMSEWVVRSIGVGRFLDWRAVDASGTAGGILVEDGAVWVFTGVYGPFTKNERDCMWDEIGAIRGLWEEPCVIQKRLPRPASDHFPGAGGWYYETRSFPFRFENMWLKVEGFQELIHSWWQGIETIRGGNSIKKEAKDSYAKWVSLEETHWRQHSRELWLREGDNNTGYFHRMVAAHRRSNHVDRIKIGGVWLNEEKDVREGVANAFQHLLTENSDWKADIEGLQLEQLNQQEAENLEQPFSERKFIVP
ncbi:hypothetical protein CK203_106329 [Vitis vinifera]|uniref:Uncharacterized protein n=1 Tax=Vitis vinifera TaxID=29760 RepID=A0A438CDS6_VITVI|nr:hypothetical protein CK203_106329 [Vitis vinifera]